MIELQINPPGIEREYLRCLNLAFGNWGDARQFDWYFRRKTVFPDADFLVFRRNGKMAAGSAITYRRVRLPDEAEISVGIMTGSWTLPEYRGQGFFSRMIEESVRQTAKKNAKALLAFVTADNSSFRQLQKFGAISFPTCYLFSNGSTPAPKMNSGFEPFKLSKKIVDEMFERSAESGKGFARFVYPAARDFRAQFLERPHRTEILSNSKGDYAVIEKKPGARILQFWLSRDKDGLTDLFAGVLFENQKLMFFTAQKEIRDFAEDSGINTKEGFLTALPVDQNSILTDGLVWKIQNGDRA
jgi:hypothetical protein